MTNYADHPEEVERVTAIIKAGMTLPELRRFFRYGDAWRYARAIGLSAAGRSETVIISAILRHLANPIVPTPEPTQPAPEPAPVAPDPVPAPEPEPPTCTRANCGGISAASGLRWDKINQGIPLTWSVDRTNEPASAEAFTDEEIQGWFDAWTEYGGLAVKKSEGIGDCHIKFEPVDGPGGTLGFVLQPNGTNEEMAAAGMFSGDMTIDSSERSWPLIRTRLTGKHEAGHVFGIGHLEDPSDLMYFQLNKFSDIGPQSGDQAEYVQRYPTKSIPA